MLVDVKRCLILLATAACAWAHDPITTNLTWTQEISRLVYKHCAGCHHEGGRAMSLVSFEEARPWAKAIRDEVLARRMPPWDAVRGVGDFRNDQSLSPPEMDLLVSWVEGGAPEGDPIYLPPAPSFPAAAAEGESGEAKELKGSTMLSSPLTLLGIRPEGPLEVVASLPDGSVRRLIWVRNFRPEWNRTYYFREPLKLPKSTRIVVYGGAAALRVTAR